MLPLPPTSTLFPYTTLFRSLRVPRRRDAEMVRGLGGRRGRRAGPGRVDDQGRRDRYARAPGHRPGDRKSTRLNSSHTVISYAVFCLKKKKKTIKRVQH